MQTIVLPEGANTQARKKFYSQLVDHIDDITYSECELVLRVDQDKLVLERMYPGSMTQTEEGLYTCVSQDTKTPQSEEFVTKDKSEA